MTPQQIVLGNSVISLQTLFSSMPAAMALIDREGHHIAINEALASLSGRPVSEHIGVKVAEFSKQSAKNIESDFRRFDAGLEVPDHELEVRGRIYHVSVKALRDDTGFAIGLMVAMKDITANKETERKLAEANGLLQLYASQDHLTGLWNRRHFDESLHMEIQRAEREMQPLSLIMCDVDHFKLYNDRYGHAAGDECLRQVAQAVNRSLRRPADKVCRYGGEEFAVILPGTDKAGATRTAEIIRKSVAKMKLPHASNPHRRVTLSLGVASHCPPGAAGDACRALLIEQADEALYAAKAAGRNRAIAHDPLLRVLEEVREARIV